MFAALVKAIFIFAGRLGSVARFAKKLKVVEVVGSAVDEGENVVNLEGAGVGESGTVGHDRGFEDLAAAGAGGNAFGFEHDTLDPGAIHEKSYGELVSAVESAVGGFTAGELDAAGPTLLFGELDKGFPGRYRLFMVRVPLADGGEFRSVESHGCWKGG